MKFLFFKIVLVGAIYHLVRDLSQIGGIENLFTELGHWNHKWCGTYCDYITLPLNIFLIVGSLVVIRRRKMDILGIAVMAALLLGLIMWFLK